MLGELNDIVELAAICLYYGKLPCTRHALLQNRSRAGSQCRIPILPQIPKYC